MINIWTKLLDAALEAVASVLPAKSAQGEVCPHTTRTAPSNHRHPGGGDFRRGQTDALTRGIKFGGGLLLLFALMLGGAYSAQAGTFWCVADYGGVIDGNDPATFAYISTTNNTLGIDGDCTIKNWPEDNGIGGFPITNINYYFPGGADYFITFDNVYYTGNMSCNDPGKSNFYIYWSPGSFTSISDQCQARLVPVDVTSKSNPVGQTTAQIGVPFTYTISVPLMGAWDVSNTTLNVVQQYDNADITNVVITDDLTQTGAALTYVSNTAYRVNKTNGSKNPIGSLTEGASAAWLAAHPGVLSDGTKHLVFSYENNPQLSNISAGYNIEIDLTVVLDATPAGVNSAGTTFTNFADMWFDREYGTTVETDRHASYLVTPPMEVVEPDIWVDKTSTATAINLGDMADFTIDAQNGGGSDAWNTEITDVLPAGMCAFDPTATLSAKIVQADGVTLVKNLAPVTDYSVVYDSSSCKLILTMTDAAGPIEPNQHLLVSYQTQLDSTFTDDLAVLTNVAGATKWFSAENTYAGRREYDKTLSDGSPTVKDFQDSQTVTAALTGYNFTKAVRNVTSQTDPVQGIKLTAVPGDTLHYHLRIFNVDQTINALTINDTLDTTFFDPATLSNVTIIPPTGYTATWSFDPASGLLQITGAPLNLLPTGELEVDFDITLKSGLANGTVSNQATLTAAGFTAVSDDPNINGAAGPDDLHEPTDVDIQTPGPLAKANTQPNAAIGQQFDYIVTVPATLSSLPLYDVQILDTLPANLRFVSAQVVSGGALTNSGTGNSLILEDLTTGLDIPANSQASIAITVELLNSNSNQNSVPFNNSASYTFNRVNGLDSTRMAGGAGTTTNMTVVEPRLTAAKTVSFVSPAGKPATDPATVGDVLEYKLTIPNSGTSEAFDVNVVDTLPANVALVGGSATAAINGVADPSFIVDPFNPSGTTVVWGRGNGDGSLDVPAGQTLVLTYQVTVVDASSVPSFTNEAYVDWTSLDGNYPIDSVNNPAPGRERTGAGCPSTTSPNDYCFGPASVTVIPIDNTSITKSVFDDSYTDDTSTSPHVLRVGDTVTYDLTLNLQEYTTRNVVVEDTLPAGMELVSFSIDPGAATFNYTLTTPPAAGATGTLTWNFGDIENVPSGDNTPVDPLVIRYVAKVITDPATGIDTAISNSLTNAAQLSYTGGNPAVYPARLTANSTIEVHQPQMSTITKVDQGTGRTGTGTAADPYQVDLANDVMQFRLESCNTNDPAAPAYGVELTDALASQLDETSITTPVVAVGGTTLTAGTDYTYTPPAGRGGTMSFVLNTPVNPGQCVTVDYNIGFHTDFGPNQTWNNSATLNEYLSRPSPDESRLYDSSADNAQVWMTNVLAGQPLAKTLTSPAEATIGENVTYEITVPATPVNAALDNVVVTDTLHGALEYVGATAVDSSGNPVSLTDNTTGQNVDLGIIQIPAGEQVIITLTARVANNSSANSGTSVTNTASYTYTEIPVGADTSATSTAFTIIEPSLTIAKSVNPSTPPIAGDILTYTVNLTAASGANFSSAFDSDLLDTLSLGLAYVANSARVGGVAVEPSVTGDGVSTAQTLTWSGIDVPEGSTVAVTYNVQVLPTVVAGQDLTNSATVQWTSLDGPNANERDGSGSPTENDYFAGPATANLPPVPDDNSLAKAIVADTYVDASSTATDKIVRIGDTATYRLTLSLGDGTNRNVTVQDVLPTGMAYAGLVSITPASGSGPFTYTVVSQPTAGDTGTLTWNLGDVVNTPGGTPVDTLVIEYTATVLPDAGIAQVPTTGLPNTATLGYLDAGGNLVVDPARLVSSDTLTARQPMMSPIVKLGNGAGNTAATPLNVDVATDTVQFHLESCNTNGLAPAYGVELTDDLADQLDETSITTPVVAVGGTTLTGGTDYTYTPPAGRGGTMNFVLNTPINPGQCVTVDYNIGFHTDFGPNQNWNNSATLDEYWSLLAQSGQKYVPTGSSQFYMTNQVAVTPLAKVMDSPTSGEATIGEDVVYKITVPGTPVSAELDNLVVSDTLPGALEYVGATATLNGAPLAITTTQSGQDLSWNIATIPAGQQVEITLTTRLVNNALANAGTSVTNTASYTYTGIPAGSVTDGSSQPLIIVEPSVTVAKSVVNVNRPGAAPEAGDILRYTVALTAASGAVFSNAFDADLVDTLSLGLAYQAGTATISGAGNTITDPTVSGDGTTTPQTLTWDPGSTAEIDIAEGTTVTITYDVQVLDTVAAGQVLTNNVTARWTGLDGVSSYERTGADGIGGLNDYLATTAAPPLTVPIPTLVFQKTVDKPVANPGDRLRYTIVIQNPTGIGLQNLTLTDEIDRLNATPMFQPGSIGNVSVPAGAGSAINGDTLNVTGLTVGPNETLTITLEAVLATNLKSNTVVLNQAELSGPWTTPIESDDPNVSGDEDPTQTIIPADGVVYASDTRQPLAGATLTMRLASTGTDLPASCFVDPSQQNQVTPGSGEYKFDLKFDPTNCPEGADYLIAVTAAPAGYMAGQSLVIPPVTGDGTASYSVPVCSADAVSATPQCEAQVSTTAPTGAITTYYLHLTLDSTASQIYNNHIPVDPYVEEKIYITKRSSLINVTRGQLVPYTITFKNTLRSTLPPLGVVDTMPPGFKYVKGSSRLDDTPLEPAVNGRQLAWNNLDLGYNKQHTLKLLLVVGAGVSEGEYVNQAQVIDTQTGGLFSEVATATVRVIPDPTFDCTDVIGKVFDDANLNGYQDDGEQGLAGVRVVTVRGLIATTDRNGRFHITCAVVPDEDRGSNFILKLDDRTLPTGYRMTTENPRVQRATRGKAIKFDFGAAIHRVVGLDVADGAFEPNTTELRLQWQPRIALLIEELKKAPSVLRLSYLADVEGEGLVRDRLDALKKEIAHEWKLADGRYQLTIETEVFWRRGGPP